MPPNHLRCWLKRFLSANVVQFERVLHARVPIIKCMRAATRACF
jgi:hypothetical protein